MYFGDDEKVEKPPTKKIINCGLIFCILTIITMSIDIAESFAICNNNIYWMDLILSIVTQIYIFQLAALLMLWYLRIQYAFHDSIFKISNTMTVIYVIMTITTIIFATIATWLQMDLDTQEILWTCCYVVYFLMIYILNHLFVFKLYQLYHQNSDKTKLDTQFLIGVITRIMILNFVSILVTILAAISLSFYGISAEADFFHTFAFFLDNFTNLLCVILSYSYYSKYYFCLFGCCHRYCVVYGSKIIGHNEQVVQLQTYIE